jgi:hypothetical protein
MQQGLVPPGVGGSDVDDAVDNSDEPDVDVEEASLTIIEAEDLLNDD